MKALSIHPYFALQIFFLEKTVECRSWTTNYRGEILICSTAKKYKDTIPGHALCVVTLKDVVPMKKEHLKAASMYEEEYSSNTYAWILDNVRVIEPFAVKGKLSLWECPNEIRYLKVNESDEQNEQVWNEYFEPLVYSGDKEEW